MYRNLSACAVAALGACAVVVMLQARQARAESLPPKVATSTQVDEGSSVVDPPRPVAVRAVRIGDEVMAAPPRAWEPGLSNGDGAEGTREGGETCASALVIGSLPFNDVGDTRNNLNDIESENCEDALQESKDVVYKYTPASNQIISVSLCATSSAGAGHDDTRLLVFEGNCNAASEYACNNDSDSSCNHDTARFAQAEIPALEVTGGLDYYFVVDGFAGDNGTYIFDVKALSNGACCRVVGGQTCTDNVSPLTCTCLAEKWTEGGSCGSPACVLDPVPFECPPNHIFGPGFELVARTMWIIPADDFFGTSHSDAFWNLAQPIKVVAWWGCYSLAPGLAGPCDKPDVEWTITFYDDDCGQPGDILAGPFDVTPERLSTGFVFPNLTSTIFRFSATLPVSVSFATGWVGMSAKVDPNAPDCAGRVLGYFTQPATPPGDNKSWFIGGASPVVSGDMPMCLSAPSDAGACCDDSTGTCTDATQPSACAPPSRFAENTLCAALNPDCGMGACCTVDGNCSLTDQAGCVGTWKPGVLCAFANCPPSNDNCNLVAPSTGSLSYTFTNRTNGATDDDCPALEVPSGWEAFGLADTNTSDPDAYSCYDLILDYCGTSPVFVGDAADFLLESCCGLPAYLTAVSSSTTARVGACCRDEPPGYDGNVSMEFHGVASDASWYYPVLSGGGSVGEYVLNVNAVSASPTNIGDANGDGRQDMVDYGNFNDCLSGQNVAFTEPSCACLVDSDADHDVDLADYAKFQAARTACASCTGTAENEPGCSGANNGCDATTPVFGAISCGQTICGTAGDGDSDWYQVTVGASSTLTWTVTAEFPVVIAILDGNFGNASCAGDVDGLVLAEASGAGCDAGALVATACVRAGTYWVRVAPQDGETVACGSAYKGVLTCAPCSPTGATGACCRANALCTPNSLEASCVASEGKYRGDGSSCPCPAPPAGDECLSAITLACNTGSVTFNRSQLTSNASDPVNNCELNNGGPFAKDGSIWFKWNSGAFGIQRLHLDLCCQGGGTAGDSLVTVFPARTLNENPSTACPAILALDDGQEIGCDDDSCVTSGAGGADLCLISGAGQALENSRTYYILVEIYDSGAANEQETFTLTIGCTSCTPRTCPALPVCTVGTPCPGGATLENEPDCFEDYVDNTNNGCSPGNPEAFQFISCGQTLCGETGNYTSNGLGGPDPERDRDWFEVTLTEETQLEWTVHASGVGAAAPGILAQIWRIEGGCDQDPQTPEQELDNRAGVVNNADCDPVTAAATVEAGRYAVTVFGRAVNLTPDPGDQACGSPWIGTLTCQRGDIMPTPADACGSAPTLTGSGRYSGLFGAPLTHSGDGESTCDGALGSDFCDGPAEDDVYWTYVAPCTGKASIEVRSGPAPMVLSAHSACPATCDNELPGGLGAACSDFGGGTGGALPKILLDVKAGVSYVIRLAVGVNTGPYELVVSDCVECCNPLPHPNCPVCGNGELEGVEECDDGDNTGGDGCDAFCRTE